MKRLLILALSALLCLGCSSLALAAAQFSGEIQVGVRGQNLSAPLGADSVSTDYAFGQMILSGKLGDDLTGKLVFNAGDVTYGMGSDYSVAVDEASVTFSEDWGSLKFGYYGWNNHLTDILSPTTKDIESQTNIAAAFNLTDELSLELIYGFTGSYVNHYYSLYPLRVVDAIYFSLGGQNPFGADLGYTGDTFGGDLLYFHYSEELNAWGVNVWVKLGDVRPFLQYRNLHVAKGTVSFNHAETVVGITYDVANSPFYARAEVAVGNANDLEVGSPVNISSHYSNTPWGARLGYRLNDGAKFEVQYQHYNNALMSGPMEFYDATSVNEYSLKLICAF